MSDDERGPSVPDDDPDRTEIHREEPFGDLSMGPEETLDAERTLAVDETVAQDADATVAFDEDATMAEPKSESVGDLPVNLPATTGFVGGNPICLEIDQRDT